MFITPKDLCYPCSSMSSREYNVIIFIVSHYILFCYIKNEWMNEKLAARDKVNTLPVIYIFWQIKISFCQWNNNGFINQIKDDLIFQNTLPHVMNSPFVCVCVCVCVCLFWFCLLAFFWWEGVGLFWFWFSFGLVWFWGFLWFYWGFVCICFNFIYSLIFLYSPNFIFFLLHLPTVPYHTLPSTLLVS